jgi:hypothetical protein
MPFEKGKSGNPGGRPKEKPFAEALRMELASAGADHKKLREIAKNLITLASEGSEKALPAIREIADRMDGKPAQAIENGDGGAFEVIQKIERVIVKPADQNG